ncbi:MAG: hypothetical protein ACR2NA_02720 [Solirubrobacterales bacterium]
MGTGGTERARLRQSPRRRQFAYAAVATLVLVLVLGAVGSFTGLGRDGAGSLSGRGSPLEMVVQDDAELLHRSPEQVAATLDALQRLGVDRVRITAGWFTLAPDRTSSQTPTFDAADPAAYPQKRWATLDRAVRLAAERGLRPMLDVGFWAPRWATSGLDARRSRRGVDVEAFTQFATAVARRYRGDFRPPGADAPLPTVTTYTLWNEPNHPGFWLPQWTRTANGPSPASPHAYRRLVSAAYPAVKRANRAAAVLVGGTAAHGGDGPEGTGGVAPLRFVRELACVDNDLRPLRRRECAEFDRVPGDGFSHHPYTLKTTPAGKTAAPDDAPLGELDQLTTLLDRLAEAGRIAPRMRDVYLTEYGYETNPPDPGARYSPEQAARFLAWGEALAWRTPQVRSHAQFLVRDIDPGPLSEGATRLPDFQTGLTSADGRPKPALAMFTAPVFAERRPGGGASVWGRIRPGEGRRPFRLQAAQGNRWSTVADGRTDTQGVIEIDLEAPAPARVRLVRREGDRWIPGIPVRPRG